MIVKRIAPVLAVALLAGCGSSKSSSTSALSPSATGGSGAIAVSESEFKLTPPTDSVKAGTTTIKITNNGTITHAFAVQTGTGVVRTAPIAPRTSATLTVHLAKPGSYTFFCPIDSHRKLGMVGTLSVGTGGATSGAAATTSTSSSSGGGSGGYGY
jgi:plastocyanin